MSDRTMVLRSGLSLVFYLAFAGVAVVAQDAPGPSWGGVTIKGWKPHGRNPHVNLAVFYRSLNKPLVRKM